MTTLSKKKSRISVREYQGRDGQTEYMVWIAPSGENTRASGRDALWLRMQPGEIMPTAGKQRVIAAAIEVRKSVAIIYAELDTAIAAFRHLASAGVERRVAGVA